jgi:hypothetical protein
MSGLLCDFSIRLWGRPYSEHTAHPSRIERADEQNRNDGLESHHERHVRYRRSSHSDANPAYLGGFLFSGLLRVDRMALLAVWEWCRYCPRYINYRLGPYATRRNLRLTLVR